MTFDMEKAIRSRRSVRTYDEKRPLSPEDRAALLDFVKTIDNPFGVPVRYQLLDHAGAESGYELDCRGVVTGMEVYMAAVLREPGPLGLVGYGYSVEQLVLFAESRGIGTCWVGGTMNRSEFERAVALTGEEQLPAVITLGYEGRTRSLKEQALRKTIRADSRKDWDEIFFENDVSSPLSPDRAGDLAKALELVRLSPSAVNKQPWRVVRDGGQWHFLERRSFFRDAYDIQQADMGIALAHFEAGARLAGHAGRWVVTPEALGFPLPEKTFYVATWMES